MDTLYLEHLGKKDAYFAAMKSVRRATLNIQAVALAKQRRRTRSTRSRRTT